MKPQLPFRPLDRSSPPPGASFYNELLADIQRNSGGYSGGFGEEGPAGQIVAPPMPWEDQGNIQPFMARLTSKYSPGGGLTLYHFKRVVESDYDSGVGDSYIDDPFTTTDDTTNNIYFAFEVNNAPDVPTEADGVNMGAVVELRPSGYKRAFWFVWQSNSSGTMSGMTLSNTTLTGTTTYPTGSTLNLITSTTNNTTTINNYTGGAVNYSTTNFNSTGGTFTLTVPIINVIGGSISLDCTSTMTQCHFTSASNFTSIIEPMPVKLTTGLTSATAPSGTMYYNAIDNTIAASGTDGTFSVVASPGVATLTHRAYIQPTTTQSISDSSYTALNFAVATEDTDSYWSAGSPTKLTVPGGLGGKYLVGAQVILTDPGGLTDLGIFVEKDSATAGGSQGIGTIVKAATLSGQAWVSVSGELIINATQSISASVWQKSGGSSANTAIPSGVYISHLWMVKIG